MMWRKISEDVDDGDDICDDDGDDDDNDLIFWRELIFKRLFSNVLAGIFLNCVVFALKNMASVSNHKILGSSVAYSKDLSLQA